MPHQNSSQAKEDTNKHSNSYIVSFSSHGITHLLNAAHPGPDNSMTVDCRHIEQRYVYESELLLLLKAFKPKKQTDKNKKDQGQLMNLRQNKTGEMYCKPRKNKRFSFNKFDGGRTKL